MKPLSALFSVLGLVVAAYLHAAPTIIVTPLTRTEGVLSLETFPGPPNYKSAAGGDEAQQAWILTATKGGNVRFELVVVDQSEPILVALRRYVGKKIAVEGTLKVAANGGHHHTPFLIIVELIRDVPDQLPNPTSPSVTPPAGAGAAPSVTADH